MKRSIFPARTGAPVFRMLVLGVFAVAAAIVSVPAHAQRHGPGMDSPGMMFGGSSAHMARRIDRMLDRLKASDAQRAQVKQIVQAAMVDLKTQREAARGLREKGLQIFTAPNVDAAAAESLRQQMLAQHDQASRRMLQVMLDVSGVLTPEQRAKFGEQVRQRQQRMQRPADRGTTKP
ncbi:MAG: Spy/CpxP family protein refolding chaperone [Burkholderiaceae bacterium]